MGYDLSDGHGNEITVGIQSIERARQIAREWSANRLASAETASELAAAAVTISWDGGEEIVGAEPTARQVRALRDEAAAAGDDAQVVVCHVALGDSDAAEDLMEQTPGLRSRVEALGIIATHVGADVIATRLCTRAIAEAEAAD